MDRIGLDVVLDIEEHYLAVHPELGREAADLLRRYVSEGKLGVKTGEGFYKHPRGQPHAEDHLIYLDVVNGQIISGTVDGKQTKTLISGLSNRPDGVQLDPKAGKLYWTCMGRSPNDNDGSVMSANLDGSDIVEIVPVGKTFTAKQNYLDVKEQTLYWCDREGGRIQSCKTDGSELRTIYDLAPGQPRPLADAMLWCVGITLDKSRGLVYWTQKGPSKGGKGRIMRMSLKHPEGGHQTLYEGLPEPVDLELDVATQRLYWTDRGSPPSGNSLNRADVSAVFQPSAKPRHATPDLVLTEGFHETIGLTIDGDKGKIYISDLRGTIWETDMDGGHKKAIIRDAGNLTGITFQVATA